MSWSRETRHRRTTKLVAKNNIPKAATLNGVTMALSTVSGLEYGWCRVRHHFTDMYVMGTLTKAIMVATDLW